MNLYYNKNEKGDGQQTKPSSDIKMLISKVRDGDSIILTTDCELDKLSDFMTTKYKYTVIGMNNTISLKGCGSDESFSCNPNVKFKNIIFKKIGHEGDVRAYIYTNVCAYTLHFTNCLFIGDDSTIIPIFTSPSSVNTLCDVIYESCTFIFNCDNSSSLSYSDDCNVTFKKCVSNGSLVTTHIDNFIDSHMNAKFDTSYDCIDFPQLGYINAICFIQSEGIIYSIDKKHYNLNTKMYNAFPDELTIKNIMNEQSYIGQLAQPIKIGTEKFRPIDKFIKNKFNIILIR